MKKKIVGVLFVISMLTYAPVRAADVAEASTDVPAVTVVDAGVGSDVVDTEVVDTTTVDDAVKGGVLSSLKGLVVWPWNKGQQITSDRPFTSGVVLTAAAFVAAYKLCPWFREVVLGCTTKSKKTDEDLF